MRCKHGGVDYLASTISETAFVQLEYSVQGIANTRAYERGPGNAPLPLFIDGKLTFVTGALGDWIHYREKLAALPKNDEIVSFAIADARITNKICNARTRPWDR